MTALDLITQTLPTKSWTTDPDIIAPYLTEWRDKYQGQTPLLLTPSSTEEVVQMVNLCREQNLKIVPQGGNTGLVGGQIPQGEVLISLRKMNRIRSVNARTDSLIAEAGVTLQSVQEAADNAARKFPLSLASEGTCTVGGVLSTNAGGVHVLKYGTTKDLVFGVEAVLADGSVFNGLTSLRKDNTGYDLSRLFLGAEGTLGIITAASLKLFPKPGHIQRAMVGVGSPEAALQLLETCRSGSALAMFEVMPRIGLDLVLKHIDNQRDPFADPHPWYCVIDWEVETREQGEQIAEARLTEAFENGIATDAVIAQSETQAAALLSLRENMSAAQKYNGGSIKQDITIPLDRIPEFFEVADAAMQAVVPGCRPVGFGHFGDGNIHYNIAEPEGADTQDFLSHWQEVSEAVFDIVDRLGGSISAEHGIGIMKRDDLARRAHPVKLAMMAKIKSALDPDSLFNPRVLLDRNSN